jgi:hypothetical protein
MDTAAERSEEDHRVTQDSLNDSTKRQGHSIMSIPPPKRVKVYNVHPEAAALGWETKGNKLTVSEGVVNGMQLPGESIFTPVPSTFDVLIDVKTLVLISEMQKFVTIAVTLQRVSDGMTNFRGFVSEPAQQERFDSDPEQDEEDFYPAIVPVLDEAAVSVNYFVLLHTIGTHKCFF